MRKISGKSSDSFDKVRWRHIYMEKLKRNAAFQCAHWSKRKLYFWFSEASAAKFEFFLGFSCKKEKFPRNTKKITNFERETKTI